MLHDTNIRCHVPWVKDIPDHLMNVINLKWIFTFLQVLWGWSQMKFSWQIQHRTILCLTRSGCAPRAGICINRNLAWNFIRKSIAAKNQNTFANSAIVNFFKSATIRLTLSHIIVNSSPITINSSIVELIIWKLFSKLMWWVSVSLNGAHLNCVLLHFLLHTWAAEQCECLIFYTHSTIGFQLQNFSTILGRCGNQLDYQVISTI